MRICGAVFFLFLAIGPASAQFGNVVFPGLARAPIGGNPWGNVVLPATPGSLTNAAFANNRGGGGSHSYSGGSRGYGRGFGSGVYAYPVFVGGYGYGYGSDQPAQQPPNTTVVNPPPQPPVVINQYFGAAQQPDQGEAPDTGNLHFYQAPTNPVETAPGDSSYYLIAMQDHTIYSAVAYYVEGDTLHYFTAGNVHNQVSLALVDRTLTERLNHERNVDVRLPKT
ncbi:MAG: hypothetical protein ABSH32_21600 [Bryobacteraceae bacterium]|jgi:hypothetical protein